MVFFNFDRIFYVKNIVYKTYIADIFPLIIIE